MGYSETRNTDETGPSSNDHIPVLFYKSWVKQRVQAAARNASCSLSYLPRSVAPRLDFSQLLSYESGDKAQDTAHSSPGNKRMLQIHEDGNTPADTPP